MEQLSKLQQTMHQLAAPYENSETYYVYGDVSVNPNSSSMFWDSDIEIIDKYESSDVMK